MRPEVRVIQTVLFFAFFGGLVTGALIADAVGVLPSAALLEEQDRARFTRYSRSL